MSRSLQTPLSRSGDQRLDGTPTSARRRARSKSLTGGAMGPGPLWARVLRALGEYVGYVAADRWRRQQKLNRDLKAHQRWLKKEPGGKQLRLDHEDLSGLDFSGHRLREARLEHCNLAAARLDRCTGLDLQLHHCQLRGASMKDARLKELVLAHSRARGMSMRGIGVRSCTLSDSVLRQTDFRECAITELSEPKPCDWRRANLAGALLDRESPKPRGPEHSPPPPRPGKEQGKTRTRGHTPTPAPDGGSRQPPPPPAPPCQSAGGLPPQDRKGLLAILRSHEAWLGSKGARGSRLDLSGVRLDGLDLRGRDLRGARLTNVEMRGCDLSGARMEGVRITDSMLVGNDLTGASVSGRTVLRDTLLRDNRGGGLGWQRKGRTTEVTSPASPAAAARSISGGRVIAPASLGR